MSVYGERAGALSVVCADAAEAELVLGQLKATVRRNYSSPPIHAAGIISRVLSDPALRATARHVQLHRAERSPGRPPARRVRRLPGALGPHLRGRLNTGNVERTAVAMAAVLG
jgi:hypothetical protein